MRKLFSILMFLAVGLMATAQPPLPEDGPGLPLPEPEQLRVPPLPTIDDEIPQEKPPRRVPTSREVTGRGEAPNIVIQKIGPNGLIAGKPLVTDVIVRNQGEVAVFQVEVEDEIPANGKLIRAVPEPVTKGNRLHWTIDALRPGQEKRFRVEQHVTDEQDVQSQAKVTYSTVAAIRIPILKPQLAIRKTGPERVAIGDSATFIITVSNPGTAPAENVIVRDLLPEGLEHPKGPEVEAEVGTLDPGESRTIKLTAKVTKPGRLVNQVVTTADTNLKATATAPVIVGRAELQLVKTGPTERYINTDGTFFLQLTNTGDAPARKVRLMDAIPAQSRFVAAGDGGRYDSQSNTVQWNWEVLNPGESVRVSLKLKMLEAGEVRNHALARADGGIETKADAIVNVIGVPALLLEVVDKADPIEVASEVVYEVRVLNQGSGVNTSVQLMALLPEGLKPIRVGGPLAGRIQGQQIIFEPMARLEAKEEVIIQVTARGQKAGDHRFKVQLQSDQMRIPVSEEESTHVYEDK